MRSDDKRYIRKNMVSGVCLCVTDDAIKIFCINSKKNKFTINNWINMDDVCIVSFTGTPGKFLHNLR